VVEDHDRAVVDREAPEPTFELVPVRETACAVCHGRFHADRLHGRLMSAPASVLVRGRANEDPIQPGVEALHVPQFRQLAPAADEGLLNGVLGEMGVAQHEPGDRVEAVDLARGEQREGLPIPAPRSLDELLSHLRRLGRAGRSTGS
jgi:hypothetical protein